MIATPAVSLTPSPTRDLPHAACAVLQRDGMYLLTLADTDVGNGWTLPGTALDRLDPAIDPAHRLQATLQASLGVAVDVLGWLGDYPVGALTYRAYHAHPRSLAFVLTPNALLYHAWLTREEIAVWHIAGRLRDGYELAAVTVASRAPRPAE